MKRVFITEMIAEGKTKVIYGATDPNLVVIQSKDDITAGDGAKHNIILGKAQLANLTTCNVFRLLQQCQIPVAFKEQAGDEYFIAEKCDMIPFEVVIRREAHGSYLERNLHFKKGHIFPKLILEFFLKTSGKKWQGQDIPVDDPMAIFNSDNGSLELFLPKQPLVLQKPFLVLQDFPLKDSPEIINDISYMAKQVFLILEKAWQLLGRNLVDFKLEFGFNSEGELRLADVVDNDSWRLVQDGAYIDKQLYRDGGNLNEVTIKYQEVAELTRSFSLPRQQIILWRASEKDDIGSFQKAIGGQPVPVCVTTYSLHKKPTQAIQELTRQIQEIPDSVLIVYCGRSNGAGPTLSAHCSIPTITVPAGWETCHEDVWSSLRTPSDVPVATILDPKNAVLAALQILAMRNPLLYANLRMTQEERFLNFVLVEWQKQKFQTACSRVRFFDNRTNKKEDYMPIVKIWGSGANIELNKKIVAFLKSVSELNIRGKNLVLIINPDHSSNQENVLFAEITILDIPEITRIERDTIATGVAHAIQSFFPSASIASTVFLISPNAGSCRLKSVY